MPEDQNFECDACGRKFDSERGLSIHQTQAHSDEELQQTEEKDSSEETSNTESQKENNWSDRISISVGHGLLAVFLIGIVVGFTAGIVAPLNVSNGIDNPDSSGQNTDTADVNHDTTPSVSKIDLEGEPVLGDENAPATLVMYEDFQCPYCRVFEQRSFGQIKTEFVDTGKLKIVWKDLPLEQLGHNWATPAAETMECVYRQDNDAFWAVKSKLFDNQRSITEENVESQIISWAAQEGVSESAVNSCLQNSNVSEEVQEDMRESNSFETEYKSQGRWIPFVSGTPSFVIFGEGDEQASQMVGAQPFSAFQNTIQSKLSE